VLWSLDDRDAVLANWTRLLRPGGRLVLVEGRWGTGVGLPATECRELVLRHRGEADVRQLGPDPALWGRGVDDERYLLLSTR
jgi:SAM-dependent methyltransferase